MRLLRHGDPKFKTGFAQTDSRYTTGAVSKKPLRNKEKGK
ncbi:hypothetical protein DA2_3935 [Desulfovibrio sp. A2]|nr:hypothetical protein DA2_3935 [Desulfovibrio sp. A2]